MMEVVDLPEIRSFERDEFHSYHTAFMGNPNPNRRIFTSMELVEVIQEKWNFMLEEKFEKMEANEQMVEEFLVDDAEMVVVSYGTSARIAKAAIKEMRKDGYKIGLIRPITLWPFPYASLEKLDENVCKKLFCLELSVPVQVIQDVQIGSKGRFPIYKHGRTAGQVYNIEEVTAKFKEAYEK